MSWILSWKRILCIICLIVLVIGTGIFGLWWMLIVVITIIAVIALNKHIRFKIRQPAMRTRAGRKVERIDTLVIGDICSQRELNKFCNLHHALCITAPGRAMNSSFLILKHLTSLLEQSGHVVIIDGGGNKDSMFFDLPYLSQITKMELGYKKTIKYDFPVIFAPFQSIAFLIGNPFGHIEEDQCPDERIVALCRHKGFILTYLHLE